MVVAMSRELTLLALLIILGVVWTQAQSCNSCGPECQNSCGTRHFRTCCFNYLKKKRSGTLPIPMDPSLRLELWLAKSRYPYFQQRSIMDRTIDSEPLDFMDVGAIQQAEVRNV